MQLIDDACRASIANLESPLQQRRRALLMLNDNLGRFAEQLVAIGDLRLFFVALMRVERFALPHRFENVRLVDASLSDDALYA